MWATVLQPACHFSGAQMAIVNCDGVGVLHKLQNKARARLPCIRHPLDIMRDRCRLCSHAAAPAPIASSSLVTVWHQDVHPL